jgi:hypothetical protein
VNAATLLAAAAIIDARAAAKGNPEWRRIADDLTAWAKELAPTSADGAQDDAEGSDVGLDARDAHGATEGVER